jgi:hypothetical protein
MDDASSHQHPGRLQAGRGGGAARRSDADAAELAELLGMMGEPVPARLTCDAPCDAGRSRPVELGPGSSAEVPQKVDCSWSELPMIQQQGLLLT